MLGYLTSSEKDMEDGLNRLAKDTGGETFFNTNDLARIILDRFGTLDSADLQEAISKAVRSGDPTTSGHLLHRRERPAAAPSLFSAAYAGSYDPSMLVTSPALKRTWKTG